MKTIYFMLISFLMFGCSGPEIARDINKVQIAMVGNKPPISFKVANLQTMKDYVFDMKGYTIAMPGAKTEDFIGQSQYGGKKAWQGLTYYQKDITLYLEGYYHISVTASKVSEYGERERAIENKDKAYVVGIRKKYKYTKSTKLYYGTYGRENYGCMIKERVAKHNKYKISYNCNDFNPSRTKAKSVTIVLTYNKPKNPTLAKEYIYTDLKRRAKRMLDSLYIKDEW